jgi:hypothetical protein
VLRANIIAYRILESSVGISTGCRLDEPRGSEYDLRWGQEFSHLHVVQTGSGAHPAPYPMGNVGSFPGGKTAGASSWPLTS